MTKIAIISDTHAKHSEFIIPECDLLIHAGDFTDRGSVGQVVDFFEWLRKQPASEIVFISGNHDLSFDEKLMKNNNQDSLMKVFNTQRFNDVRSLIKDLPPHIHYLENESIELFGLNIYGSPYTPTFGHNWAFNKDRGSAIATEWGKILDNTDILVTHGPCYDIFDYVEDRYKRFPDEDQHVGCKDLFPVIKKRLTKLKLHISGHIHSNWGVKLENVSNTRKALFCNAAVLTNEYKSLTKYPQILYL